MVISDRFYYLWTLRDVRAELSLFGNQRISHKAPKCVGTCVLELMGLSKRVDDVEQNVCSTFQEKERTA
jgi:hypothetical protein